MRRSVLALATALLFATTTVARADVAAPPPSSDTVVLKNGTRLTGKVLDNDPKAGVTIKLTNGKVRVIAARDVKQIEHAEPPEPPAEKTPPKAVEAPPPPPDAKPGTSSPDGPWEHTGAHLGAGLDGALVLSRENAGGSLKLLSPDIGAHGTLDVGLTGPLYFRLDLLFATFARTSTVPIIRSIDFTSDPGTIVKDSITNKVRVFDITFRPQIGFDWTDMLTTRLGLRAGLELASGNASDCTGNSKTKLGVGFATTPIAARFGDSKAIEVGVFFDYLSLTMPRCSVGDIDGFTAMKGQAYTFHPQVSNESIAIGELGLTATYMFW